MRNLFLKIVAVTILFSAVTAQSESPRSVRTTRKSARVDVRRYAEKKGGEQNTDTLVAFGDIVRVSGYDKPLRSSHETALFINNGDRRVERASVRFLYKDMKGRMLHSCKKCIDVWVEPGETGMMRWKSWDVQQSYYYHRSQRPRLSSATPYDVECSVDTLFVSRL